MALLIFNNASGTNEQQICQDTCDVEGMFNDNREGSDDQEIDICYTEGLGLDSNGDQINSLEIQQSLSKCNYCPHWKKFKEDYEAANN